MSRKIKYQYFQKSPRGHYSWLNPDCEYKFYLILMNIIGIDCNRYNGAWRKHYSRFHDSGTNGFLWDTHARLYKCKYLKVVTEISHPNYNLPMWNRPSWYNKDC